MGLSVRLLGRLDAEADGRPVTLPSGRALELLVRLAARPGPNPPGALERDLGPGWAGALAELEALGELGRFVRRDPGGIALSANADVAECRALPAGELARKLLLRRELAPGLRASTPQAARWLADERADVLRAFQVALLEQARALEEGGRPAEARANEARAARDRDRLRATDPARAARLTLELARHRWRLDDPAGAERFLREAVAELAPAEALEARVDLAAALVRLGRAAEALDVLAELPPAGSSRGWALVHRANAERLLGRLPEATALTEEAHALASAGSDGPLAVAAFTVLGEARLDAGDARAAVFAFGRALGMTERLGEAASAPVLAGLGHAQAAWGHRAKGAATAEKGYRRARAAGDRAAAARALLALHAATGSPAYALKALDEARAARHAPLEARAVAAVGPPENAR